MEHDLVFYSRMQHLKLLQVLHTGLYMGKVWSCPLLLQFFRRLPWLVVLAAFACPRLAVISLRLDMNCDEKTHTHIYYIYIYTDWVIPPRGTCYEVQLQQAFKICPDLIPPDRRSCHVWPRCRQVLRWVYRTRDPRIHGRLLRPHICLCLHEMFDGFARFGK